MDEIRPGLRWHFAIYLLRHLSACSIFNIDVSFTEYEIEILWQIIRKECEMMEWYLYGCESSYLSLYIKLTPLCDSGTSVLTITPGEAWELFYCIITENDEIRYDPYIIELCVSICEKLKLALNSYGYGVNITLLEY